MSKTAGDTFSPNAVGARYWEFPQGSWETTLQRGHTDLDHEEQDLISRAFPLPEVERMIRDGEIKHATTVDAFGLLRLKGLL